LYTYFKGHTDDVNSVKFTFNGLQIVSGSSDGTVKLWDASTGEYLRTLQGHSDKVYSVALSSDGIHIVSASQDTTIWIWDLINCKHLKTLHGHSTAVYTAAFSPTNEVIASASSDGHVRLWNVVSGVTVQTFHQDFTNWDWYHIKFSQDQQYVTMGSHCLQTGLPILASEDTTDMQQFPAYYMDGEWVISMSSQNRVCWIPAADRGLLVSTANGYEIAIGASIWCCYH
jgi:WD40 repeat protein